MRVAQLNMTLDVESAAKFDAAFSRLRAIRPQCAGRRVCHYHVISGLLTWLLDAPVPEIRRRLAAASRYVRRGGSGSRHWNLSVSPVLGVAFLHAVMSHGPCGKGQVVMPAPRILNGLLIWLFSGSEADQNDRLLAMIHQYERSWIENIQVIHRREQVAEPSLA